MLKHTYPPSFKMGAKTEVDFCCILVCFVMQYLSVYVTFLSSFIFVQVKNVDSGRER